MVQEADPHEGSRTGDPLREVPVLRGWRRVAGRVVVKTQDTGSRVDNSLSQDL